MALADASDTKKKNITFDICLALNCQPMSSDLLLTSPCSSARRPLLAMGGCLEVTSQTEGQTALMYRELRAVEMV
ncbi:hypothetical protein J4Q44_G00050430 [Coregonus suidteri]|uniref:Uncharacterized protein n=1 Tax=Coregonus suidteri TaxID=861788 RepID=A0AAN8R514_9TELE